MLQNPRKTLGFMKNMVYKIPPGGGKPYPASGLVGLANTKDLAPRCARQSFITSGSGFLMACTMFISAFNKIFLLKPESDLISRLGLF